MKKIITIIVLIGIVATAVLFLKGQKQEVQDLPLPDLPHYSVETIETSTKEISQTRHFLAQLLATKSALVASKFSAKIKKVYVQENDMVKKGKLLIALDDRETRSSIASLIKQKKAFSIDVDNAKRSLSRNKKLLDIEAISQEKYDNANVLYHNKLTNLAATKEKIRQAEAQLTYLNIKAPFSGRVGSILVDEGNLAIPGKPIISLNSDDQKLIFSYVATSEPILEGQKVFVNNKEIGKIVSRYDDAQNALLVAEVKVEKPLPFANKAFVNIDVVIAKMQGCSVPLNAILHRKNETSVMLYQDGVFKEHKVEVLLQDNMNAILKECPNSPMATAAEAKLSILPTLGKVNLSKGK